MLEIKRPSTTGLRPSWCVVVLSMRLGPTLTQIGATQLRVTEI